MQDIKHRTLLVLEKNQLAFEALLADIESFESTRLAELQAIRDGACS
jgi:hypothetical protein